MTNKNIEFILYYNIYNNIGLDFFFRRISLFLSHFVCIQPCEFALCCINLCKLCSGPKILLTKWIEMLFI